MTADVISGDPETDVRVSRVVGELEEKFQNGVRVVLGPPDSTEVVPNTSRDC